MVRMFVEFSSHVFECSRLQRDFAIVQPRFGLPCFLSGGLLIPNTSLQSPNNDEQDVCLGYDANEEVPVGCSVLKEISVNMGVVHQ